MVSAPATAWLALPVNLPGPARRQSIAAGWDLFKRQLYMHHTAEDELICAPG